MADTIIDPSVAGAEGTPADTYRPLGHIMRDLKAVDEEISKRCARRQDLVRELQSVASAANSYAETATANTPSACANKENKS